MRIPLTLVVLLGVCLAVALGIRSSARAAGGADEGASETHEVLIPPQFQVHGASLQGVAAPASTVYFTPQDSDDTNTIVFIYNTSGDPGLVAMTGINENGAPVLSAELTIPAGGMVRVSADALVTSPAPPASWANTAVISFGDTSRYVRMSLSGGLKADGWVAWTNNETYNPRISTGTVPLRFVSDAALVFFPSSAMP